jgi:hypothetical protein
MNRQGRMERWRVGIIFCIRLMVDVATNMSASVTNMMGMDLVKTGGIVTDVLRNEHLVPPPPLLPSRSPR